MKVCLICVELFAWGKYGGFGKATRIIGRELVKRGIEVFAVVPRRRDQQPIEELDGITVLSFPIHSPWLSWKLYKECNADIYHSQEPSFGTFLAMQAMPERKHTVTFRDPRDWRDWQVEFRFASESKLQVLANYVYEDNFLVRQAVRRMETAYCAARFLIPKVKRKYALQREALFLPTPVTVPATIEKESRPTVCFLARLDRRKRPELFFELAALFPDVHFIAVGKSRDESWNRYLQSAYSHFPNVEMKGFVDRFASDQVSQILEKSWVLINTAAREGLPNSFMEAAAHRCSILSAVDPDGFASRFGYYVQDDNFEKGLRFLLSEKRWEAQGMRGFKYVSETFEVNRAIEQHIDAYNKLLSNGYAL